MQHTFWATLLVILISLPGRCLATDEKSGTFVDPRDGNTYRWVKIADQIWMADKDVKED